MGFCCLILWVGECFCILLFHCFFWVIWAKNKRNGRFQLYLGGQDKYSPYIYIFLYIYMYWGGPLKIKDKKTMNRKKEQQQQQQQQQIPFPVSALFLTRLTPCVNVFFCSQSFIGVLSWLVVYYCRNLREQRDFKREYSLSKIRLKRQQGKNQLIICYTLQLTTLDVVSPFQVLFRMTVMLQKVEGVRDFHFVRCISFFILIGVLVVFVL